MILGICLESAAVMTCFSKPSAERLGCLKKVLGLKRDVGQKERLKTEVKSIEADS